MKYAKLELNVKKNNYNCVEVSDAEMLILGTMFADDIRDTACSYKQTLADNTLRGQCGNFIFMAKENGYVVLSDLYSEEIVPTEFKILQQSFIQLLDEWQEKVCKHKPKEVIIKHLNDQFFIETHG